MIRYLLALGQYTGFRKDGQSRGLCINALCADRGSNIRRLHAEIKRLSAAAAGRYIVPQTLAKRRRQ